MFYISYCFHFIFSVQHGCTAHDKSFRFPSGRCVCSGPNWSGVLCDVCSEAFYGPMCQPLMKVLQVAPDRGPDVGGTIVHVYGHNFPNLTTYECR